MVRAGGFDGAMAVQTMCDGYEVRCDAYMLGVISSLAALGKSTGKI
jgi:L-alanine-DL-glutamate epimerase-like enolase superfamily enzyme